MLPEIDTQSVTLTPEAAQAVRDMLAQRGLEGYALRVYVAGQSCHGAYFGLALDKEARDGDTAFDTEGLQVLVDNQSLDYLRGATIEYVVDPQQGAGFVVNSPTNSLSEEGCGCGSSCSTCGQ